MSSSKHTWLHSIPTLVAVAVGLIYGFGALTIYGQIKGEGVNAVQAMGLVPIDQILSRGIGSIVSEFGQMLVSLLLALPVLWALPKEAQKKARPIRSHWPLLLLVGVVFLLMALSSPMKEALVVSIAVFVAAAVVAGMLQITQHRGEQGARAASLVAMVAGASTILALNVGNAFIRPTPLPIADLTLRNHGHKEGGLITTSDGFWYLAQDGGSIESVASSEVTSSGISYPEREPEQSVLDWILDRPPSSLTGAERKN